MIGLWGGGAGGPLITIQSILNVTGKTEEKGTRCAQSNSTFGAME
ncbi:hypothetical protein CLOSTMETH_01062 [[Clostridium] methylpentosum DSM 5476]|uniref:Uncharacterized protein n=1 Tax=[Clostridium] methylpentosum DSM 5476 TaxID=537013 RepID=C0EB45_9FIRM|nr:hypothetical protein CLOSTMETH_01062 [[Clostridium] methylpentosum DSM 5476]